MDHRTQIFVEMRNIGRPMFLCREKEREKGRGREREKEREKFDTACLIKERDVGHRAR